MAEKLRPQHRVFVEIALILRHLDAAGIPRHRVRTVHALAPLQRTAGRLGAGHDAGHRAVGQRRFKPVFALPGFGGVYIGLIALAANIAVAALTTAIANARGLAHASDATQAADYEDAAAIS